MTKGLQNLPCGERLKKFGLFTLENKRLRRDLSTVFQYLKNGYKKERGSLFTRSKRYKLHWERFYSDIRIYIFLAGKQLSRLQAIRETCGLSVLRIAS